MFPFPPPDTPVTPLNFLQFFAILKFCFGSLRWCSHGGGSVFWLGTAFPFLDAQRTISQF